MIMKSMPRALTFIELLIVVIITGVLVGLAVPNFRSTFSSARAESFSRQLQSYMNNLRGQSIVEQKVLYLDISADKSRFNAWRQLENIPFKAYPIPEEVSIEISKNSNINNQEIYFYPDGRIDAASITVLSGNRRITLTTEGSFGKVKMQK